MDVPIIRAGVYAHLIGDTEARRRELTFAVSETEPCVEWLASVCAGECPFTSLLPVLEYWRRPWQRENYRWTGMAHRVARLQEETRAA